MYAIVHNKTVRKFQVKVSLLVAKGKERESGKLHKSEIVLPRIVPGCGVAFDERDACLKFTGSCFDLLYDISIHFLFLPLFLSLAFFRCFSFCKSTRTLKKKMEGEELAGEDWARDEEMKLKAMKRRGVVSRAPPPPPVGFIGPGISCETRTIKRFIPL